MLGVRLIQQAAAVEIDVNDLVFFAYPRSGGFEHPFFIPTWMVCPVLDLERVLDMLSRYFAFRTLVVLETDIKRYCPKVCW